MTGHETPRDPLVPGRELSGRTTPWTSLCQQKKIAGDRLSGQMLLRR